MSSPSVRATGTDDVLTADQACEVEEAPMDAGRSAPLLSSLATVADATSLAELTEAVFGCIRTVSGIDTGVIVQAEPAITNWSWPGDFYNSAEATTFERFNSHDPWILTTHSRGREAAPLRISDRMSHRAFRSLPIYDEVFRELKVEHQVVFSLPGAMGTAGPEYLCVALNRAQRDFSDSEIARLELLRRGLGGTVARAMDRLAADRELPEARPVLSIRETAVLRLVAGGHSNQQICHRLGISVRTVDKHLQRIYAKCGVTNRVEATLWWLDAGLGAEDHR